MEGGGEHQDATPLAVLVSITVQLLQSHLPSFPGGFGARVFMSKSSLTWLLCDLS